MDFAAGLTLGLYVGAAVAACVVSLGGEWLRRLHARDQKHRARQRALAALITQMQRPPVMNVEQPPTDVMARAFIDYQLAKGALSFTPTEKVGV